MKAKRILALLLTAVLIVSLLPTAALADGEPAQADGVYQIGTADELRWFAANPDTAKSADAVLTTDIDLGGQNYTPICNVSAVADGYAGTFDGRGHSITGLKIDATEANWGLFALVNGGTIKNLKVTGTVSSTKVVGGIVGKLQTGTIENCSMAGSVTTTGTSTKGYVGGIVGTVGLKGTVISGCSNSAAVSGSYAGGIVGYNKNAGTIEYCYNTGAISGTTREGGIAGQQSSGTVANCYNVGTSTYEIVEDEKELSAVLLLMRDSLEELGIDIEE